MRKRANSLPASIGDPKTAMTLRVLGNRVDALTMAYRVELDPSFVAALRARADVAKRHGRASFEWGVLTPRLEQGERDWIAARGKLGPIQACWVNQENITKVDHRSLLWGELRYSRALKVWNITNEPFYRLHVELNAPGGEHDDKGIGWTVEIVWYAQTLAKWGLARVLEESAAIASLMGDVREQRLRRIDLCADVAGWRIVDGDESKLVKRSRAKWSKEYGEPEECEDDWDAKKDRAESRAVSSYARKSSLRKVRVGPVERRLTGLNVGRGGALMSRIYDKCAELERDAVRREAEEDRWREAGWDGIEPVTRVEFQIRGAALTELGLRDPDCVLDVVRDESGKPIGQNIATVTGDDGCERQASLVDRLDAIWKTCLGWIRLVEAQYSRSGRLLPVSRLPDDARWSLLRTVRFSDAREPAPLGRFRPRSCASAAQALGVTLSQAGRDGVLRQWEEEPDAYEETDAEDVLRDRVRTLKLDEAERVIAWLIERFGGPVGANIHLAVRANAARMRFLDRDFGLAKGRAPPPESGPRLVGRPRSVETFACA